ncbi:MAG: hypothetical protein L3K06_08785, partial [Thermoplasmata archaeon]|nr:hypothetical protein [Thermoplasmata archaeon]
NASGTVVHLPPTAITHFPGVHGRVLLSPWRSLAVTEGLGAPVNVIGCPAVGAICGPPIVTDTGGFFNASVPPGGSSLVEFVGLASAGFGTAAGGVDFTTMNVPAIGRFVELPTSGSGVPAVAIFGSITGRLADGSTWNVTDATARAPCGFCTVTVTQFGGFQASYFQVQTGPGGNYTEFQPDDGTSTRLTGYAWAYWWINETVPGNVPSAAALSAAPLTLPHYGWISLRAVDANTSLPIQYYGLTASTYDAGNATTFSIPGVSRADGYANISAPLGPSVTLQISADGYFAPVVSVSVGQSRTVGLGNVSLIGGAASPGAWVRSQQVNVGNSTPIPTLVDARTHLPLPDAVIALTNPLGVTTDSIQTNGLGQFLLFSPTAPPSLGVYTSLPAYEPTSAFYNASSGAPISIPQINLTGDGIVAGRVLARPGDVPVYNAEVDVCPPASPGCGHFGISNATGYFWVPGAPGFNVVSVVSGAFLANFSVGVTVISDHWSWVGTVPVFAFASVFGTLRGLPLGE